VEFEVIEKGSGEGIAGNLCPIDCGIKICLINVFSICPCVEGGYCEGYCSDYNCVCH